MPIVDGVILATSQKSGAERSFQAAAKKYGQAFWKAYARAHCVDYTDPQMRRIFHDMMRDDDPGEFLMNVFGEPLDADDVLAKALSEMPSAGSA